MKQTLKKCFVSTFILIHIHTTFEGKEISRKSIFYTYFFTAFLRKFTNDLNKEFKEFHSFCSSKFREQFSGSLTEERPFRFPRFIFPEFIFNFSHQTNRKVYFVYVPVIK